jgi:hypothetical protein
LTPALICVFTKLKRCNNYSSDTTLYSFLLS